MTRLPVRGASLCSRREGEGVSEAMQVRDATSEDAATIAHLNRRMAMETEGRALDPETALRGAERGLARPTACRYLVAEQDGCIIGQAMITFEWSDWRDGFVWWLQSVYIVPAERRQGVFTALFQAVTARARSDGDVRALRLYVHDENDRAAAAYEKLGMRQSDYKLYELDPLPEAPGPARA